MKVLSTKILSPRLKEPLQRHHIALRDYNAIEIVFQKFSLDLEYDAYIFTSQNAVRGFLKACDALPLPGKRQGALSKPCFCVGEKTARLLSENGLNVIKIAKNSKELAHFIAKSYKNDSFLFICGNRRREELPSILSKYSVRYKEIIAYNTLNNEQDLEESFDGVLFYSPSGVQSYTALNNLVNSTAFCIGDSTAREASKHTESVVIARKQRIESVLEAVVEEYLNNRENE